MKWPILLTVTLLVVGCSDQKRFQRFLANNPEFAQNDTIRDTVFVTVPGEQFDTAIVLYVHDTVRIDTGRLHVRIIRTAPDSFFVEGKCDTVYKDVPFEVVVEKLIPCPPGYGKIPWWAWAVIGALALALVAVALRRR